MFEQTSEQQPLPFRVDQKLSWLNVEEVEKRRLWGKRIGVRLLKNDQDLLASTTSINSSEIDKLTDASLRYALRFQDAAKTVGWVKDGAYSSSAHSVTVWATEEGVSSRLLDCAYTGIVEKGVDSFMENLYLANPQGKVSEI